jgi:hypothetical protein
MDQLHTRLDALEQQMHTVTRRLRWWRGLACGLVVLVVLTWVLPAGTGQQEPPDGGQQGLAQRVAALEELLTHFSREKNDIFITGANLHLVNGLGRTDCGSEFEPIPDCPNGLGNLIVGYNELRDLSECDSDPEDPPNPFCNNTRTGSHNVVVGAHHNFSRFGGAVVGNFNDISGDFASVSGGILNRASGLAASISGGGRNEASGENAAVSGGDLNVASNIRSSVSGGGRNRASGEFAAVSGGDLNVASGERSSVSGGFGNQASGGNASISGGFQGEASGELSSVSGGDHNTASGGRASVSGGSDNVASGFAVSVSGGRDRTAEGEFDWVAGDLFEDE